MMARLYDWRVYVAPGADPGADPLTWVWEDVTSLVRHESGITITRGRGDEFAVAGPQRAALTVDNRDGRWVIRNVLGEWYGQIRRNMPLRVQKRHVVDAFGRTVSSGWGASDTGRVWTTAGGSASDFAVSSGLGRHSHTTVNVLRSSLLDARLRDCEQVRDVRTSALLTGAALVTGSLFRYIDANNYYWLRCEFNAGGTTVQLKITKRVGGVETQLANVNPLPSLAYAANTPLRCRSRVDDDTLALKVWSAASAEPSIWSLTATDSDLTAAGQVGEMTWLVGGNTNTLPVTVSFDNYELLVDRFTGLIDALPSRRNTAGTDRYVPITASGITRRLARPAVSARSALYRTIVASTPVAYWPLEDGVDSTQAASGLSGGQPMVVARDVMDFISDGPVGSAGAAQPQVEAANSLSGVITGASSTAWQMSCWARGVQEDPLAPVPYFIPLEVRTSTGKILRLGMQMTADTFLIAQYDTESQTAWTNVVTMTFTAFGSRWSIDTGWHLMQATFEQVGADVLCEFWVNGVFASGATFVGITIGAPVSASAIGRFGGVAGDISRNMREVNVDHIAVHNDWPLVPNLYLAGLGYPGEGAADRIIRVCGEDGLPVAVSQSGGLPMGPQARNATLPILRDAEATDVGVLYERTSGELHYLARESRYNRAVGLALDYAQRHIAPPFEPVDDDQRLRNDITATRSGGSSARYADADSVAAEGSYDALLPVTPQFDSDLLNLSAWGARLGTVGARRWPSLALQIARWSGALIDSWLSVDIGSRTTVANVPEEDDNAGLVDLHLEGYTETLMPHVWRATANCSPAGPWDVATVDGGQRVAADGSTLALTLASGSMTLSLASTITNGVWRTTASDPTVFPLDVRVGGLPGGVGGERITLSGISGTTSPQTATISARGVNGVTRAWPAGTEVDVWSPAITAL